MQTQTAQTTPSASTVITEVPITDTMTLFSKERGHIIMSYPNKTTLTIVGDPDVITQITERLNGITVEYKER